MKKVIIATTLLLINLILGHYLFSLQNNRKALEIKLINDQLLYQTNNIELNSIDEFIFENYFVVTDEESPYKYSFNENFINIQIGERKYSFEYQVKEPIVIEKTVYKEVEVESNTGNEGKDNQKIDEQIEYESNEFFFVDSDYLSFAYGTSLDEIRNAIINNVHTTFETSIDYKELNSSSIGQYSVIYKTNNEIIEIIVEIT